MIRKLISTSSSQSHDVLLLILRVSIAALMLVHGLPKLQALLSGEPVEFMSFLGMGAEGTLALVVAAEVVCSILVLIGLGTRIAVAPLIVTMLVAVFYVHANDSFAKQELGIHYLLVYVILLVAGSGKYSLDYLIGQRRTTRQFA